MKKCSPRVGWRDWVAKRWSVRRAIILAPEQEPVCVRLPLECDGQTVASPLVKFAEHVSLTFFMTEALQILVPSSH